MSVQYQQAGDSRVRRRTDSAGEAAEAFDVQGSGGRNDPFSSQPQSPKVALGQNIEASDTALYPPGRTAAVTSDPAQQARPQAAAASASASASASSASATSGSAGPSRSGSPAASTSASSSRFRSPRQTAGPALSFMQMGGSWRGALPKNGSLCLGNASLIQCVHATARYRNRRPILPIYALTASHRWLLTPDPVWSPPRLLASSSECACMTCTDNAQNDQGYLTRR